MNILILVLAFLIGIVVGISLLIFKYIALSKDCAAKEQKISDLTDSISNQSRVNNSLKIEFENIASKILEEKNAKVADINKASLENIVAPFKIKIDEFKNKVENLQIYEAEKMSGLQKELEKLINLNKQVSEEANNLAGALKGENKFQGMWGELSLERIFEYVGMIEGVNYVSQKQFKNDDGKKIPDYIVNLPNGKNIVVDAKTSLVAYEKYYNSQNVSDKKVYLKEHSTSVKKHIDELVDKDYAGLEELNQPEYILMFVPIEGAVSLALIDKPDIVAYAFKKNIIIITPSTLLATLKTVEYMWRQEHQKKNVLEIARQGGNIYDKFVVFVQTLLEADKKISEAKSKIEEAKKRLSSSDKKGDSLIERAQKLKELGALTKKEMPEEMLKPYNQTTLY
ncbi:DNA recombination protein RmuC [Endomicrobiia bacterium]|nr:DNA recombination protein RmuC [Endomicrobiia bacterium]GHT63829.1 DNA recombination protein RmuC [Endomicrobiia bacterium]GHT69667.1 DNA recombination protein RmuC [Endomicrobiia bacterium]GHT73541.1 DNA recombination protein RmuC [Endomicrobiia bacterium]